MLILRVGVVVAAPVELVVVAVPTEGNCPVCTMLVFLPCAEDGESQRVNLRTVDLNDLHLQLHLADMRLSYYDRVNHRLGVETGQLKGLLG